MHILLIYYNLTIFILHEHAQFIKGTVGGICVQPTQNYRTVPSKTQIK